MTPMQTESFYSRRQALSRTAGGFGCLALGALLAEESRAAEKSSGTAPGRLDPLSPKKPHFAPRAKNVIFIYMTGGVSHVDSFDYKPRLFEQHGKKITVDNWQGKLGNFTRYLKRPDWKFKPNKRTGTMVSDLFPHIREVMDDICLVRSMESNHTNHYEATLGIHTGSWTFARPSLGSWVSYGLGTENRNLPSFLVIAPKEPYAGGQTWGSDFLPGSHQGTRIIPGANPVPNLKRRTATASQQRLELDLISELNRKHLEGRELDQALDARIRSFETAFGMQQAAPELFDLSGETDKTLALYGIERGKTSGFGWQCLMARRLAEKGVRFIELIDTGSSGNWDSHGNMNAHGPLARNVDKPIAGLIKDLKQRGMLNDTLVVWTTEFGRTPYHEEAKHPGREHHHQAFASWFAGGGTRAGLDYGSTDEHGIAVADKRVHVHDFHATLLHILGLDHEHLTYRHAGRDYRLTDVHGHVAKEILA